MAKTKHASFAEVAVTDIVVVVELKMKVLWREETNRNEKDYIDDDDVKQRKREPYSFIRGYL
jgi:hypothetical protein